MLHMSRFKKAAVILLTASVMFPARVMAANGDGNAVKEVLEEADIATKSVDPRESYSLRDEKDDLDTEVEVTAGEDAAEDFYYEETANGSKITATSEVEVFPEDTTVTSLIALSKTAAADVIYVSGGESITNTSGEGTEESPYRSLAYAVSIAEDGAAVIITKDITLHNFIRVSDKNITIDGQGYKISRGKNFKTAVDDNREEYNPAMFEVVSTGDDSELILKDITVSDFGGMSVIRVGDGAAVSMENSWISGDISLSPEDNNEKAAIYLLGDSRLELDEGSGISNMKNINVIYMTDNAYAKINGKISDIDNYRSGKTDYPLVSVIKAEGSSIADLNGTLENIKGACIKLEGNDDNTPIININGTISNAVTTFDQEDGASLISATHGIINISGEINNFDIQSPEYEGNVYLIKADSHSQCCLHKGASISKGTSKGRIGSLIYINDHSEIIIQGEISDNYIAGHTVQADNAAQVYIEDGALIEGNYFANHEIIYIGSKNSKLEMNGGTIRDNQFRTAVGVVQVVDRDSASSLADIKAGTIVENHHVGAGVLLETE